VKPHDIPSTCDLRQHDVTNNAATCTSLDCPLYDAVYYFAPSLAQHAKALDLINRHDAIIIFNLQHWDRDSLAHPSLTPTVAESQAFGGRKKIVLINRRTENWRDEFLKVKNQVGKLNRGKFRERIDFWDVEVLDVPCPHVDCHAWWASSKAFLGYVYFDDRKGEGRMVFCPRRKAKERVDVEKMPIWLGHS
jgi:hypothetical protein